MDYGFGMYHPILGRWHVKEPLADLMTGIPTYAYAYNNPVNFVDHFGLSPGEKPSYMQPVYNKKADADQDGFVLQSEQWYYNCNQTTGPHDWAVRLMQS